MEGAVVMTHGVDQGLILPPRIAPIQVVVVPIWRNADQQSVVLEALAGIKKALHGIRVEIDDREGQSAGWKFNEWELKGVPQRVEIGPRDVQKEQVVVARRDIPGREGKAFVPVAGLRAYIDDALETVQQALYDRALAFRERNTVQVDNYDQLREAVANKFVRAYWCGDPEGEARLKEDARATSRCIPLDQDCEPGICAICGQPATEQAIFARAY